MNDPSLSSAAILYGSLLPGGLKVAIGSLSSLIVEPAPVWQSADERFLHRRDVVRVFDPLDPRHLCKGLIVHVTNLLVPKKKSYEVLFQSSPEDSRQIASERLQMLGQITPGEELWTANDHGIFRGCVFSQQVGPSDESSSSRSHRLYCLSSEDDPEYIRQYPLDQVYRI